MHEGFLKIGGNVVIHNGLSEHHARQGDCPSSWFRGAACDLLTPQPGLPFFPWWEDGTSVPGSVIGSPYPSDSDGRWATEGRRFPRNLLASPSAELPGSISFNGGMSIAVTPHTSPQLFNLLPNPSFETNANGWVGARGTIARVSAPDAVVDGSAELRFTLDGTPGGSYVHTNTDPGTVSEGGTYTASVYARRGSAFPDGPMQMRLQWLDSSGTYLSRAEGVPTTINGSSWTRISATGVAPAGANRIQLVALATWTNQAAGQIIRFDAAMVNPGGLVPYVDGNSPGMGWAGLQNNSASGFVGGPPVAGAGTNLLRATTGTAQHTYIAQYGPVNDVPPVSSASAWVRMVRDGFASVRVYHYNSAGTPKVVPGPATPIKAGKWTRVAVEGTVPDADTVRLRHFVLLTDANGNLANTPDSEGFDVDAMNLTPTATVMPYRDGNSPGWAWSGAANASDSFATPVTTVTTEDGMTWWEATLSQGRLSVTSASFTGPVTEGLEYTARMAVASTPGATLTPFIEWLSASGTVIGTATLGTPEYVTTARTLAVSSTAPAAAVGARLGVQVSSPNDATVRLGAVTLSDSDEGTVDATALEEAPWYDAQRPDLSSRFFGAFGLSVTKASDGLVEASFTDSMSAGGQFGRWREGSRELTYTAVLVARGEDALEYGMDWLRAVLRPGACGQHGSACGVTDASFFAACPPSVERAREVTRVAHDVMVVSGPFVKELHESRGTWAYVVEWTLKSEHPWVYGETEEVTLPKTEAVVYQDAPYNLIPYPSAELSGASSIIARNYSTNPSVEVDLTGWAASRTVLSGSDPQALGILFYTRGLSTPADGAASAEYRIRATVNAGVASGTVRMRQQQVVPMAAVATGRGARVHLWTGTFIARGSGSAINAMRWGYQWQNDAGAAVGSAFTEAIPSAQYSGRYNVATGVTKPAGATRLAVWAEADLAWNRGANSDDATSSDIRFNCDALAVIA